MPPNSRILFVWSLSRWFIKVLFSNRSWSKSQAKAKMGPWCEARLSRLQYQDDQAPPSDNDDLIRWDHNLQSMTHGAPSDTPRSGNPPGGRQYRAQESGFLIIWSDNLWGAPHSGGECASIRSIEVGCALAVRAWRINKHQPRYAVITPIILLPVLDCRTSPTKLYVCKFRS